MLRLALAVLLLAVATTTASGQDGFRVTYEVDAKSRPDQTRLAGRVVNERNGDVLDVSVTAEALDARGRVLARGIAFVDARIGGGESRPFVAVVPAVPGVARYRVRVTSYRTGFTDQQGP